jgi:hypothetical protein
VPVGPYASARLVEDKIVHALLGGLLVEHSSLLGLSLLALLLLPLLACIHAYLHAVVGAALDLGLSSITLNSGSLARLCHGGLR